MIKYSLFVLASLLTLCALGQAVHYKFSAPNAVHHEAVISVTATGLPAGNAIFRMSRSSPGRYATHEFGKNIYHLKAMDDKGNSLPMERVEADVYSISQHNGVATLQYTLFANHADGTYASIDKTGFHLNMPATFMWVKGLEDAPISLELQLPDTGWKVATQLFDGKQPNTFTAPHLQYFFDAPIKAGPLRFQQWMVTNKDGLSQTIRIAFETEASEAQLDAFAEKVKKITAQAAAVFGEYPAFDNGVYTFLASLNPYVKGDGMEHRNSTMVSLAVPAASIEYALGTFSHEFFHAWNVERIRPQTLEPFNFERSNVSDGLWLAEGFTQYFGELMLLRSGQQNEDEWLNNLTGFINAKQQKPGGRLFTVINNSQQAVFVDAGVAIDKNNFANTHSSYYITGAATALAIELELRNKYNKTLDDFMQTLWKLHGKTENPYTMNDLQNALAETSGDAKFAAHFFDHYVYDSQLYDYASGLQPFGLSTRVRSGGKPWIGSTRLEARDGKLKLAGASIAGQPLYEAQLDMDHEIISLDGNSFATMAAFTTWLESKKPGDVVTVVSSYRGLPGQSQLTIGQNKDVGVEKKVDATVAERGKRTAWWSAKQ